MRKIILFLLITATMFALFAVSASADTGPKPFVEVSFENASGSCYATLLSEREYSGPWRNYEKQSDEEKRELSDRYGKKVMQAFADYKDTDGFYFLGYLAKIDRDTPLHWGYYAPTVFKILVYNEQTGKTAVSGICRSYAFHSYFTAKIGSEGISAEKGSAATGDPIDVLQVYRPGKEILSLTVRILVTVAIEILVAALFGILSKRTFPLLLAVNLVTQIGLNVLLNFVNYTSGLFAAALLLPLAEIVVWIAESILYLIFINKLTIWRTSALRTILYALTANLASFFIGGAILFLLPLN